MFFNQLIVPSLIASSALIATVSGANAPTDDDKALRELVANLQNRVKTLEGELSTKSKNQREERPRGKTRGLRNSGIRVLDDMEGKGGKGKGIKTPDHSICYGDDGEVAAFHINEWFLDGDMAQETMDLGLVELKKDEGLLLEISASTLIVNAIGGVVEQTGSDEGPARKLEDISGVKRDLQGRFYITGSGIIMRPVVRICPEIIEECQTEPCIRDTCMGGGTIGVEPNGALPLSITVIGGYQENFDEFDAADEGDHFGYEIEGALDISTNTAKFYIPSDNIDSEYLYVTLEFSAATAGIHWDLDNTNLPDWTLGAAVLGPHLIEITKPKADDSECMFRPDRMRPRPVMVVEPEVAMPAEVVEVGATVPGDIEEVVSGLSGVPP